MNFITRLSQESLKKGFAGTGIFLLNLALVKSLWHLFKSHRQHKIFEIVRIRKRAQISDAINEFVNKHSNEFIQDATLKQKILSSNVNGIKQLIEKKEASIKDVLLVLIERSIEENKKYNFISEVLFEDAYQEAVRQDNELKNNQAVLKENALFGIPISLKDFIPVKGYDTTFGITGRCFQPEERDAYQVQMIRLAKGIIFVKTTSPQMGKNIECYNHITGLTTNPWNILRTPGGSSGGEGAIIASRGSFLGIGTDIGGSLRVPAAFSGIASHKPSNVRWHGYQKFRLTVKQYGWAPIKPTAGPMARSVDDLALMMSVQLNPKFYETVPFIERDILYKPIAFDYQIYNQNKILRIGVLYSFDVSPASEACKRVVREAAHGLERLGHTIVEFKIDHDVIVRSFQICFKLLAGVDHKGEIFGEQMMGERHIPHYNQLAQAYSSPLWLRKLLGKVLYIAGQHRIALMTNNFTKSYSAMDYLELLGEYSLFQEEFKQIWESQGIDALILPVASSPALPHGMSAKSLLFSYYCTFWNVVNFSAGNVPFGKVQENEQIYQGCEDLFGKYMKTTMAGSAGLPLAVQVVTKPFEDELCLNVMKQIEGIADFQYL